MEWGAGKGELAFDGHPPPFSAVLYTVDRIRNIHNNGGGRRSAWPVLCLCFCVALSRSASLRPFVWSLFCSTGVHALFRPET